MPDPGRLGTRVNLTLPDEVISVIDRLSAASQHGRATVIRGLLEESVPQLAQLADALEKAQQNPFDSLKDIADLLRTSTAQAEQMELDIRKERKALMRRKRGRAT